MENLSAWGGAELGPLDAGVGEGSSRATTPFDVDAPTQQPNTVENNGPSTASMRWDIMTIIIGAVVTVVITKVLK